jgi:hypothetical protein
MTVYLFYLCRGDAPQTFEAYDLADDEAALAWAGPLLRRHASCSAIDIWQADRAVARLQGDARRHFPEGSPLAKLSLVESVTMDTGVAIATYGLASET